MSRYPTEEEEAEKKRVRDGYRASYYTTAKCKNCGRLRVLNCKNEKHICEKCKWDQDANEYDLKYPW